MRDGHQARRARAQRTGVVLCITSACCYATGPAMLKGALLDGMGVWTLLSTRMAFATLVLVVVLGLLAARRSMRSRRLPELPAVGLALGIGAIGYGAQLALFTLSLDRISASLTVILFNTFPILVVAVATLTGRESISLARLMALALGLGGVALVALSGGDLEARPIGIALALGSGCAGATVVLGGDMLSERLSPLPFATCLTCGAAVALAVVGSIVGFHSSAGATGWVLTAAIAIVPGVLGIATMLDGVARIGPSLASVLLTLEPPVAVVIAWIVLGDSLTDLQLVGGVLALIAVGFTRHISRAGESELEIPS